MGNNIDKKKKKEHCKRANRHHHFQGGTSHVRTTGEPWILELIQEENIDSRFAHLGRHRILVCNHSTYIHV